MNRDSTNRIDSFTLKQTKNRNYDLLRIRVCPPLAPAVGGQWGGVGDDDVIVDGVRMVLVRDIGVQVCGDSPLLNSTREDCLQFSRGTIYLDLFQILFDNLGILGIY